MVISKSQREINEFAISYCTHFISPTIKAMFPSRCASFSIVSSVPMGKLQRPSSPNCVVMDASSCALERRRGLLSRGNSMHMFRSSSMPRLLPSPQRTLNRDISCVWGNDSCARIQLDISLIEMDENEREVVAFLKEIRQVIEEQTKRKANVEQQMSVNFKLAKARLASGSRLGAILSMRKAHKNKTTKAYIAAARYQLIALRKEVEAAYQRRDFDMDLTEKRIVMKGILAELTVAKPPMPHDEDLLKQLQRSLSVGSSSSHSSS